MRQVRTQVGDGYKCARIKDCCQLLPVSRPTRAIVHGQVSASDRIKQRGGFTRADCQRLTVQATLTVDETWR